ncbi:MAG: hypothetical protein ACRDOO_08440 [Actinomadura sp.]
MTLEELMAIVQKFDEDQTVYVREPWTPDATVVVTLEPEDGTLPPEAQGHANLLDVFLINDILDTWRAHHGTTASPREAAEAVIHYAGHDAYLMPET